MVENIDVKTALAKISHYLYDIDVILFIRYGKTESVLLRSPIGKGKKWYLFRPHDSTPEFIVKLILNRRIKIDDFLTVVENLPFDYYGPKIIERALYNVNANRVCNYHLGTKAGTTLIVGINTAENKYWFVNDVSQGTTSEMDEFYKVYDKLCLAKGVDNLEEIFTIPLANYKIEGKI